MAAHAYNMPCFYPLTAYRDTHGLIRFDEKNNGDPLKVPCGQCLGCRLERSRQWAMRIMHEAQEHEHNIFLTLTYNDEHVPPDHGLVKKDFQNFMKKLRNRYVPKNPFNKNTHKQEFEEWKFQNGIRYYQCGEYGDETKRPHYHAILFGFNVDDWQHIGYSDSGEALYTSQTIEKIWGKGFITIGTVTFESAGYVARYCMKKLNGQLKEQPDKKTGLKPYERIHPYTLEQYEVLQEYSTMSRNPGIAHHWFTRFSGDVYPKDYTTIRGHRMQPPRFYDEKLRALDPDMYDEIKATRALRAYQIDEDTVPSLSQKETVKKAQFKQLNRSL